MFGRIAGRYDMGNRVLSLGRDQAWRRKAVALLQPGPDDVVLDIGAGTGDLSLELAKRARKVAAVDFSRPMLEVGLRKAGQAAQGGRIEFIAGDALDLPFADGSFDGATTAFTVRNLASMDRGFSEMCRVLKPSGRLVCLEFTRSASSIVGFFYRPYLNHILPFIGGRISGDRAAYAYLATSIEGFSTPQQVAACMRGAGFARVDYHLLNLGTVALHVGYKQGRG